MCFVNCHLAEHLEAVNRRNADFDHIYRNITFGRSINNASACVFSTAQPLCPATCVAINSDEGKPDLAEADLDIFCGDFNYRLFGITYDEARDFVSQRSFDWLREKDQLRAKMKAGKVFQGMREALIRFPPTYKFERGKAGLGGYDSGYEACMDVIESDHKPVRCKFKVQVAHVDRSIRRQEFGKIFMSNEKIRSIREELRSVPETSLSTNKIVLQNQDTRPLTITNRSNKDDVIFQILCDGWCAIKEGEEPEYRFRGSFGLPRWLEVTPAIGIIKPKSMVEISIHHDDTHTSEEDGGSQYWRSEDTRDKVAIL